MEQTTGEAGVIKTLGISAEEKSWKLNLGLFFTTYKIPLFSLVLFGSFVLRALNPETLHFESKRQKTYRFTKESLGYFIGDGNFFEVSTPEEIEGRMIALFPQNLQSKVKKIIRPVLVLCEKYELDPFWVLSVLWTESHFKHEVTSKKGAKGLMQIMPPTYLEALEEMRRKGIFLESDKGEEHFRKNYGDYYYALGYKKFVSKLRNLEVGIYYLKGLLESFGNNHYHATVAYNMGPYWTKKQLRNNLPVGKKNHYLNKVMKNYYYITKTLGQNNSVTFIPRI